MITYSLLAKCKEIAHFCTTRNGGVSVGNYASFNLSPFSGDNSTHYAENRRILCSELDISAENLIIPFQTHGTDVCEIDATFFELSALQKSNYLSGVDAIFTSLPSVCIGVTTADCVPILFFDPVKKVVAAAHAGWRGTCGRIGEKTVQKMVQRYHCKPDDILVVIGPSISVQVYEVGVEVVNSFKQAGFDLSQIVVKNDESYFLDLWTANQQSLMEVGVLSENIELSGICTFTEHERFFSARRLGIKSGRLLSGIMLRVG